MPGRPAGEAGRVSCPWIVIAVVFPFGKPLRAEEGERLGYTVGRCHTWSPAHRTPPLPGEGQGRSCTREGVELPRKAELLVKGSRRVPPTPSLTARPGWDRACPGPHPPAPGDKKPLRVYLFPMTFGDTAGRGVGDWRGQCQGTDRWLPHVQLGGRISLRSPPSPTEAHPHAQSSSYTV